MLLGPDMPRASLSSGTSTRLDETSRTRLGSELFRVIDPAFDQVVCDSASAWTLAKTSEPCGVRAITRRRRSEASRSRLT